MGIAHVDNGSLPSAHSESSFRLLDLPGEHRNEIYRCLFDDITSISATFKVWENHFPHYDGKLAAYAALVSTCRAINQEARTIFYAEYLPKMTMYIKDFRIFVNICGPDVKGGLKASTARFVLRTPILKQTDNTRGLPIMQLMVGSDFSQDLIPNGLYHSAISMLHSSRDAKKTFVGGSCVCLRFIDDAFYLCIRYPRVLPKYPQLTEFARSSMLDEGIPLATETIEGRFCDLTWQGWVGDEGIKSFYDQWAREEPSVRVY